MGIVNVTPDSFSGDGIEEPDLAVAFALTQLERGSDILDVGAESTRPGHRPVPAETEIARIVPVLEAIRNRAPSAILSVDTHKNDVLRAAAEAGAEDVYKRQGNLATTPLRTLPNISPQSPSKRFRRCSRSKNFRRNPKPT